MSRLMLQDVFPSLKVLLLQTDRVLQLGTLFHMPTVSTAKVRKVVLKHRLVY